jgi:hypothetical protein
VAGGGGRWAAEADGLLYGSAMNANQPCGGATLLTSAYAADEARRTLHEPDHHRHMDALVGAVDP